jgi:flagellar basal-body rod protein FlgC
MLPDRIFTTFQTASQGLAVQREKITVASRNIANSSTSAPPGSGNIYRPLSVKAMAPAPDSFRKVLFDSVASLKQTHADHFTSSRTNGLGGNAPRSLGPTFAIEAKDSFRYEYDPGHPDADENGMVRYPDVDLVREMTRMVSATRLYEANLSSIEAEKEIIKRSLEI